MSQELLSRPIYGIRQKRSVDGTPTGVWQLIQITDEEERGYKVLLTDASERRIREMLEIKNR